MRPREPCYLDVIGTARVIGFYDAKYRFIINDEIGNSFNVMIQTVMSYLSLANFTCTHLYDFLVRLINKMYRCDGRCRVNRCTAKQVGTASYTKSWQWAQCRHSKHIKLSADQNHSCTPPHRIQE